MLSLIPSADRFNLAGWLLSDLNETFVRWELFNNGHFVLRVDPIFLNLGLSLRLYCGTLI